MSMTSLQHKPAAKNPSNEGDANAMGIFRYLLIAGLAFTALMMALEPEIGFTAPPYAKLLFWTLQVGSGLFVLQSVLYFLTRFYGASRLPSWALVLLSGVLGAAALAPIYWLIGEGLMVGWFGYPSLPEADESDIFGIPISNPVLSEYLDIVVPVTIAWALICLPRLHWLVPPLLHKRPKTAEVSLPPGTGPEEIASSRNAAAASSDFLVTDPSAATPSAETARSVLPAPSHPPVAAKGSATSASAPTAFWQERLPAALGTDVIAVASELQYLRVWTTRGCALILGALSDVEAEGADYGLRVHRSWWVARSHMISLRRTATGFVCLLSDGRQIPVSRRRRAEVLARFGERDQTQGMDASKSVADAEL
jgi:hypothetical protein